MQEFVQLTGVVGEIQPGHGNPTKEEIVSGLYELSSSLHCHKWKLIRGRDLPSPFPVTDGIGGGFMPDINTL